MTRICLDSRRGLSQQACRERTKQRMELTERMVSVVEDRRSFAWLLLPAESVCLRSHPRTSPSGATATGIANCSDIRSPGQGGAVRLKEKAVARFARNISAANAHSGTEAGRH
jgi:hypothetical protein